MTKRRRRRHDYRLADALHLMADGDPAECENEYSEFTAHKDWPALWPAHGAQILENWRQTGYTPSDWWLGTARWAGIDIEGMQQP